MTTSASILQHSNPCVSSQQIHTHLPIANFPICGTYKCYLINEYACLKKYCFGNGIVWQNVKTWNSFFFKTRSEHISQKAVLSYAISSYKITHLRSTFSSFMNILGLYCICTISNSMKKGSSNQSILSELFKKKKKSESDIRLWWELKHGDKHEIWSK